MLKVESFSHLLNLGYLVILLWPTQCKVSDAVWFPEPRRLYSFCFGSLKHCLDHHERKLV